MSEPLSPERWARVERLFEEVIAYPDDQRAAQLRARAGSADDEDWLVREVESLLRHARTEASAPLREAVDRAAREAGVTGPGALGTHLGPYRIESELGRGGMGVVYRGVREGDDFEQRVAIKLLPGALYSEEMTWRFRNERRILASLEHPGVARFLDGGTTAEGVPYVVMEYVDGVPIDEYCDRAQLGLHARLTLFEKVCGAVLHAHGRLVVHRDIKPANILVDSTGAPRLLDFGIAKLLEPDAPGDDRTVTRIMTPPFASPEQLRGEPATTATDVYALGGLLYLLLTGRRAHQDAESRSELAKRIVDEDPTPPSVVAGDRRLEGDLDTIVLTAMRRDPSARYASVDRLVHDLTAYRSALPISARSPTLAYRARKFVDRNRAAAAAGLVALLAVAGGTGAATVGLVRARSAEASAQEEARVAEQVSDFLVGLFGEADPGNALGEAPSARSLLDNGAERIDRELAGQPELRARLKRTIAASYSNLGEPEAAARLYEEALDLIAEDTERAGILISYGGVLRQLDRHQDGLGALSEAIEILEPRVDTTDATSVQRTPRLSRSLAYGYQNRGVILTQRGDSTGMVLLEAAVRLLERLGAEEREALARALTALAFGDIGRGDHASAERRFLRAVELFDEALDPRHPEVLVASSNLAALYAQMGVFDSAGAMFERLLPVQEEVWGPMHPRVAQTLSNLGALRLDSGDDQAADRYLTRAIAIHEARPGGMLSASMGMNNLARLRERAGAYAEAEALWARATEIRREVLGTSNPRTTSTLLGVADMRRLQEDWAGAEEAFAEAISHLRSRGPVPAEVLTRYAEVLRALGRETDATAIDAERARGTSSEGAGGAR